MWKTSLIFATVMLVACKSAPPERTYWDLTKDPIPVESDRDKHCAWIRSEIGRMESAFNAAYSTPWPAVWQAKARDNIAALQTRSAQVECDSVRLVIDDKSKMSFDQCYAKCRELTSRPEAECFDTCK